MDKIGSGDLLAGPKAVEGRMLAPAGLCFFLLAAQFMLAIMLGASMAPAYDMNSGAISDLGIITETAMLFNVSLIATGTLNALGGLLFYMANRNTWVLVISLLAGIGAIGAGIVTLQTPGVHGLFALLAFLAFNVQSLVTGTAAKGPMRLIGWLLGAVGLAYVVVMVIGDAGNTAVFGPIGHGGAERMIVYPPMLWLIALGGHLMAR